MPSSSHHATLGLGAALDLAGCVATPEPLQAVDVA